MFYIDSRLYISDHLKFKIKIIKHIHEFLLNEHVERLLIYNKISCYYYWLKMIDTII